MSFESAYAPVREAGNGVKTAFTFSFKIFNTSDIVAGKVDQATNVETPGVLGVDYTVAINPTTDGGTLTWTVAPTANEDSFIRRELPLTQTADIPTNNILRETQIENALDKNMMVCQQLQAQIDRALLLPETSLSSTTVDAFLDAVVGASVAAQAAEATATAKAAEASLDADSAAASAAAAAASAASLTIASQAEAEAGTDNTKIMTPLRVKQEVEKEGAVSIPATNISGFGNVPACYVSGSTAINPSGTLTLDTEAWDSAGQFASNKFTPLTAGYYLAILTVSASNFVDGKILRAYLQKNGSGSASGISQAGVSGANSDISAVAVGIVQLNGTTDYINGAASQNTGGSLTVSATLVCIRIS